MIRHGAGTEGKLARSMPPPATPATSPLGGELAGDPWAGGTMSGAARGRRTLGFLLRETSRLMRRRFVYHSKRTGLGLNRSEASLLLQIFYEPGIKQVSVANLLDLETISVVRLVDSLEAAGLVNRRPHATDRRVRTLWLTEAGEIAVAEVRAITEIVHCEALASISAGDREHLLDTLLAIREDLLKVGESADSAAA